MKRKTRDGGLAILSLLAGVLLFASGVAAQSGPALWIGSTHDFSIPGSKGGVIEIRPGQLSKSGQPKQVAMLESGPPLMDAAGLAFNHGNLWVVTLDNEVLEFTPSQLNHLVKTPNPTPAATITSADFNFVLGCTSDRHGDLWIVDPGSESVHELSKAQLDAGTAEVTPAVTISAASLASPAFAAFDRSGNLWVSSEGNGKLIEFSSAQLSAGGTVTPAVTITSNSLDEPGELQFDSKGNLWVSNAGNSTVAMFTRDQLKTTGTPAAAVVLSPDNSGALNAPWGLQFDPQHRLWVFDYVTGELLRYSPAQLKASGSPTPRVILTGLPLFASQLTFGPRH